jgi:hypothetical protein
MVRIYLTFALGHPRPDIFVPALKKAEIEQLGSSLVVQNNDASISEEHGEYTLFPEFPLELRLKIWVSTFKEEHVDLNIQKFWPWWPLNRVGKGAGSHTLPRPRFPVALYVNRESRIETMRHYWITSTTSLRSARPSTPSICANFSVDSRSLDSELVTNNKYTKLYTDWLSKLASLSPGGLTPLKELEIRNIWWHQAYKVDIDQEKIGASNRAQYIFMLRLILRFKGLRRICFTLRQSSVDYFPPAFLRRDVPECRETIQAFMERHKYNFICNTALEVKVLFWSEQNKYFICSTRKGNTW